MSNLRKAALSATLLSATLLLPVSALAAVPGYSSNISSLVAYLQASQDASGKITGFGGETSWTVMGLAAVGIDPHTVQNGGVSLVDFLKNNPPTDTATTGWERDLLAVTAAGENPFTFGGRNYVAKVQSFAASNQIGSTTLLNDDIFGILSLISAGPSANQTIISDSVNFLIANQNADYGWSFQVGGASDSNDTAVAIQALKSAANKGFTNTGLNDAINDGMSSLLSLQQADGGWEYQNGFGTDGASTAWVIQALIGEDTVVTDGLDFLASLQDPSGGVQYQSGFGADTFTSSYALAAFAQVAYPVGIFQEEFEENPQEPVDEETNQDSDQEQISDDEGKVLSASDTKDDGQVLAATLPNTGVEAALSVSETSEPNIEAGQKQGDQINLALAIGVGLIITGITIRFLSRRYRENNVD